MASRLKMATIQAILQLHSLRWSDRRIAQELGVHRETVAKYLRTAEPDSKPAKAPSGSGPPKPATSGGAPAPGLCEPPASTQPPGEAGGAEDSKPAIAPSGSDAGIRDATATTGPASWGLGRPSACAPFREVILEKLRSGLSAQRIYQDLSTEHGYAGSYYSVRRFVQKLTAGAPLPFRRLECAPGFEAQVDYGTGAPVVTSEGKRRKTHVFRVVLSHSRKAYSEVSYRQTTEDFLRCLENAFQAFGGVPETIVIDNLRAAVSQADWFDPELNPKLQSFCRHYGIVILPTRPYTPRHKGKIERGIGYVKGNALKGRTFGSLDEQNRHLADWEATVADKRIHGTTRQQVGQVFAEVERPVLRSLPIERFPFFHEAQRNVNRDGHVEVAKAYYSVPPEYLGRTVWVRWDARLVRVFNQRWEQIAIHTRHEPGRFSTQNAHIPQRKVNGLERGAKWLLTKVGQIGPHTRAWSEAMFAHRGIEGLRVLQGVLSLARRHPSETLEKACETALSYGAFRLRTIRQLIQRAAAAQLPLPFLDEHPLIRPLSDYSQFIAQALWTASARPDGTCGRTGGPDASATASRQPGLPIRPVRRSRDNEGKPDDGSDDDNATSERSR